MIHLTNEQTKVPIPAAKARRLAVQIIGKKNLSIAFVTNAAIRKINRRFLQHDFATDVISFPLDSDLLGELVISAEYAVSEAAKRKIPVEEELLRYVAHGILHLLGYDDHRPADKARMWARQERELRKILGPRRS
ncbi:MAG: rRNA maturation RNase YbeY [Planctomycetota bacterium]|nr:MAG: rRNA maturation RNase YbeY [Planctomycetota bacterium]